MKSYKHIYSELCSFDNIWFAFKKARKHKTQKQYVTDFENNLLKNILDLQQELISQTYRPKPLVTFAIRDPKTRKISKSDFRDRIVHHALCNIIEQIFDKTFIHDSYANRKGKGTLKAIERFDYFKKKVFRNNTQSCYILKADIKHYFETVNHNILLKIVEKKIKDKNILELIKIILENYNNYTEDKGMPLGNLTSQFFANVYLNELDYYVKNNLQTKYYIRYVDDFVIFSNSRNQLEEYRAKINLFLKTELDLELHPEKTKIITINKGIGFLGLRIFFYHKLLKKSNIRAFKNKLSRLCEQYDKKEIEYDEIYDAVEGWVAYAKTANTYKIRIKILTPLIYRFLGELSTKEYNRHLKEHGCR